MNSVMKKLLIVSFCSLFSLTNLMADDHVISYGMEGYQCDFKDGVNFEDLVAFMEEDLNPYADKNWPVPYSGFYLSPFLRSGDEIAFDVSWVGFTNNHEDMGIVQDSWFSEDASETFSKWESLADCSTQGYYMAIEARTPTVQFTEGDNSIWAIRSCSLNEGKTVEDLLASDKEWNAYMDKIGHTGGVWRWVPVAGTSNSFEGDFYLNISFNSWKEYGSIQDDSFWGSTPKPESVISCDNPRVYTAFNARNRPFN
tara:strand:+ start:2022 stop:2786 length:765 start_codon:yes stop_codon:yes gene_type:complete